MAPDALGRAPTARDRLWGRLLSARQRAKALAQGAKHIAADAQLENFWLTLTIFALLAWMIDTWRG